MNEAHANPPLRRDLIALALLFLLGAFVYLQAHQRALDPIIDTGRDLYVAERLSQGAVLYRDLAYNYPPAAPYLLAGWVNLFGAGLSSFAAFGCAVGALTLFALYLLARRVAGTTAAAAAGLLFVSLSFAGASTWGANYLFPYAYAATVGMLFSILAVLFLLWHDHASGTKAELAAIASGLLACWTKLEYALVMAAVFAAALALRRLSRAGALMSLSIFASTAIIVLLSRTVVTGESASSFYATVSGTAALGASLAMAVAGAAGIALIAFLLRNVNRPGIWPVLLALALAILTWVLASDIFFRGWSLLQIAAFAWAVKRKNSELVILTVFGIAATARIPANVVPGWYGFALILPLYVVIVRVIFREAPAARLYPARAAWLWLPLIGLIATSGVLQQRERFAIKDHPIRTARGIVYDANPDRARILNEFLLATAAAKPKALVVIPEGVSLNYFTGVPTPLRRYIFTPPETEPMAVEQEVLRDLITHRPDTVVMLSRDLREFGSEGFGIDYNQRLSGWIGEHYALARAWRSERFHLYVLTPTTNDSR